MKIIGVTGKSGSGKSTLSRFLSKELNCPCIEIDKIGHEATQRPEMTKVFCDNFGNSILNSNGLINRKKLGNIVFKDKNKMDLLTSLTWGYIENKLDNILLNTSNNFIIFEWALLPLSKYWNMCCYRILTEADYESRMKTVLKRDNITESYFKSRDLSSIDYTNYDFEYIYHCDYNDNNLMKIVKNIYLELSKL